MRQEVKFRKAFQSHLSNAIDIVGAAISSGDRAAIHAALDRWDKSLHEAAQVPLYLAYLSKNKYEDTHLANGLSLEELDQRRLQSKICLDTQDSIASSATLRSSKQGLATTRAKERRAIRITSLKA